MNPAVSFAEWRRLFDEHDLDLPDGWVDDVGPDHWVRVFAELSHRGWTVRYRSNFDEDLPIVGRPPTREELGQLLVACVQAQDGVLVNMFVRTWTTIEFDFAWREVTSQTRLDALLAVIGCIGDTAGKPVRLTYEGIPELIFATYDPQSASWTLRESASE